MAWRALVANNEHGDFQTPKDLAEAVLLLLPQKEWDEILEPTCGIGNFLAAAEKLMPNIHRVGIELQAEYIKEARLHGDVVEGDIFTTNLKSDLPFDQPDGSILIIGNPPWVTNSELTVMGSLNKPPRANLRGLKGIEAITGSSNFDIAEFIWLKLLVEFSGQKSTVAMLCKTQTARNVILRSAEIGIPMSKATMYGIDAKKWFNVSVDACWLVIEMNQGDTQYVCELYASIYDDLSFKSIGVVNGHLISNIDAYERYKHIEGVSPLIWRQGIKHDATAIMELTNSSEGPMTKGGALVKVEDAYLFPLLKSTDVFHGRTEELTKWMVVPQRHTGKDTSVLEIDAPNLWVYLNDNLAAFTKRKSSIYKNKSAFSIFGVGDYSFYPYKVAVSGFHKEIRFQLVGLIDDKPAVFDDTCYFVYFKDAPEAALTHATLTSQAVGDFLSAVISIDSKRPVTKKILQRIDLLAAAEITGEDALVGDALKSIKKIGYTISPQEMRSRLKDMLTEWKAKTL